MRGPSRKSFRCRTAQLSGRREPSVSHKRITPCPAASKRCTLQHYFDTGASTERSIRETMSSAAEQPHGPGSPAEQPEQPLHADFFVTIARMASPATTTMIASTIMVPALIVTAFLQTLSPKRGPADPGKSSRIRRMTPSCAVADEKEVRKVRRGRRVDAVVRGCLPGAIASPGRARRPLRGAGHAIRSPTRGPEGFAQSSAFGPSRAAKPKGRQRPAVRKAHQMPSAAWTESFTFSPSAVR